MTTTAQAPANGDGQSTQAPAQAPADGAQQQPTQQQADGTQQQPIQQPTQVVKPQEPQVPTQAEITKQAKGIEGLISSAGLSPKDVMRGLDQESFEMDDEHFKALVTQHGDTVAKLVANEMKSMQGNISAMGKARDTAVYTALEEHFEGVTTDKGDSIWKELKGWCKENMPDDERAEVNKLLMGSAYNRDLAIEIMVNRFKASDQFVQPAQLIGGGNPAPPAGSAPLTRSEYNTELNKLTDAGHAYDSPAVIALQNRRLASRRKGM